VELVSAIVCTRGRAAQAARAVASLLDTANGERAVEVIVVDQSDDALTEDALAALRSDGRLRYFRSSRRGKGAALNEGIVAARGTIVVLTDDDCIAPSGWVLDMARVLEAQPRAAIAFCRVVPVTHDPTQGYVPAYELKTSRTLRSIASAREGLGLGAAMAVRRDFVVAMGGFDEAFGPGGRFPSADEWDLCLRALLTGHHVYETPELEVVHDGFRTFAEGRTHARRDWIALGAVCAKPIRAGYWKATILPLTLFSRRALWPPIADALRLRRPRGLGRIQAFLSGFASGMLTPVDRQHLLFSPGSKAAGSAPSADTQTRSRP
jgi:glycosyltransferase involved in cell wall biosynthesis